MRVWPVCEFYLSKRQASMIIEEFGRYENLAGLWVLSLIPAHQCELRNLSDMRVWPLCEFYLVYWLAGMRIEEFGQYESLAGMWLLPLILASRYDNWGIWPILEFGRYVSFTSQNRWPMWELRNLADIWVWAVCEFYISYQPAGMEIRKFGWYGIVWPVWKFYQKKLSYWPSSHRTTLIPAKLDGYERYHYTQCRLDQTLFPCYSCITLTVWHMFW